MKLGQSRDTSTSLPLVDVSHAVKAMLVSTATINVHIEYFFMS